MKITLSIDSKETIEIGHSDLAHIVNWLDDDTRHADFFSRLAEHPASEVRSAVAIKSFLPFEALEQLARDASIEVVRQVANNERALEMFDISLIQDMINRDVSVASEMAENLSMVREYIREELAYALSKHTDPKVVDAAEISVANWSIATQ